MLACWCDSWCFRVHDQPPLNRRLTAQEWRRARDLAKRFGLS
jgi:uncharacterized Fe-S radical SAM superfamily protein PflX